MDTEEIVSNIISAVHELCGHLLNEAELEWTTIRRVSLKTFKSPSLPLYSFVTNKEKELLENLA